MALPSGIPWDSFCTANKASDIGRRPKGVVAIPVSISFHPLNQAKEICSPNRRLRLLTVIRGSEILNLLRIEKGFRGSPLGGLFLLRVQFSCFDFLNAS